ncbi:MAG: DUF2165 family protein [Saprospiraceae bacterium]
MLSDPRPLRTVQITLSFLLATYLLLIVFNNLKVYGANYDFVRNVADMTTVFSTGEQWRSVSQPLILHLFYLIIIALETLGGVLCMLGAWRMWRARRAEYAIFRTAKALSTYGVLAGIVTWLGIFIAVGGEWFLMWQSKWNALPTAYNLTACFGISLLIFLKEEA